jgi:putative resolvase
MKLSAYARHHGIRYQTAWRMWQRGELPAHQLPAGTVLVAVPATPQALRPQKVAVSARVSAAEHHTHLDRQAERWCPFCAAQGWPVAQVVKECGSGVNDQRPHFLALLAHTSITHRVVVDQDRDARVGVASLQTLLRTQGLALVRVNAADEDHADLRQDDVALITSFCARRSGRRRACRTQTPFLAALAEEEREGMTGCA